jgi:hypothetical protein
MVGGVEMNEKALDLVKSYLKVFLATVLGLFLADGADVFGVDATDLKTWLAAGIASILPLIITAVDPTDTRWGKNSNTLS